MTPRRRPTRASYGAPQRLRWISGVVRASPRQLAQVLGVVQGAALLEPLLRIGRDLSERAEPLHHGRASPTELVAHLADAHPPRALELAVVHAVDLLGAVRLARALGPAFLDVGERAGGLRDPEGEVPHHVVDRQTHGV